MISTCPTQEREDALKEKLNPLDPFVIQKIIQSKLKSIFVTHHVMYGARDGCEGLN